VFAEPGGCFAMWWKLKSADSLTHRASICNHCDNHYDRTLGHSNVLQQSADAVCVTLWSVAFTMLTWSSCSKKIQDEYVRFVSITTECSSQCATLSLYQAAQGRPAEQTMHMETYTITICYVRLSQLNKSCYDSLTTKCCMLKH